MATKPEERRRWDWTIAAPRNGVGTATNLATAVRAAQRQADKSQRSAYVFMEVKARDPKVGAENRRKLKQIRVAVGKSHP
jgi:hypothetical protein